jgi:hypothetical protein
MANAKFETLRLTGTNVAVTGVVNGLGTGFSLAEGQTPDSLSFTRHLSRYPDADTAPRQECHQVAMPAARRAGRSGGQAGVLPCCFAITAKPAVPSGTPNLTGAFVPARWRKALAKPAAGRIAGYKPSRHPEPPASTLQRSGRRGSITQAGIPAGAWEPRLATGGR